MNIKNKKVPVLIPDEHCKEYSVTNFYFHSSVKKYFFKFTILLEIPKFLIFSCK